MLNTTLSFNFVMPGHSSYCSTFSASESRESELGKQEAGILQSPPFEKLPTVAEALPAIRTRVPAGRTVEHRATAAIGPAVPAGPATAGDADHVTGRGLGLAERRQRHGL